MTWRELFESIPEDLRDSTDVMVYIRGVDEFYPVEKLRFGPNDFDSDASASYKGFFDENNPFLVI